MARKGVPKKRGKKGFYYANVMVGGVHLRECLGTDDWQQALSEQAKLVKQAEDGQIAKASSVAYKWLHYSVDKALDAFISHQQEAGRSAGTLRIYSERAKPIKRLLGDTQVTEIDADVIHQYQATRLKEGVSGRTVNMEVGLLRLLLKKVKRWRRIEDDVEMKPERHDLIPRVLTDEEKKRLFSSARSNSNWYRALFAAAIAVNSAARKHEVLRAKFEDVDLFKGIWRIPKSKTQAGCREIALNPEARSAFAHMINIAEQLGMVKPEHYIFCRCQNKILDYGHPQKSVTTSWRKLTRQAGLRGFRIHDLRHQAITELAENDVPLEVMKSMAGHVSRRMTEHYTHIRTKAKQRAVAVLGGTGILEIETPVTSRKQ